MHRQKRSRTAVGGADAYKLDIRMSQNRNVYENHLRPNRPKYIMRNEVVDYL